MKRMLTLVLLAMSMTLLLTGCYFKSIDDLYTLPEAPEAYQYLQNALEEVQQQLGTQYSTTVEYAVPLSGENTQTVQLLDLNDSGTKDFAVAFFRVSGAENPLKIYIFRQQPDETYEVYAVIEGDGSAITSIAYADLDGVGSKEIIVSWQISDGVHFLAAYSVGLNTASELLMTNYTGYQISDIDRDGQAEILVVQTDAANDENGVEYYDYSDSDDELTVKNTAPVSAGVETVNKQTIGYLQDMIPALFVTWTMEDGSLVTDIFACRNGLLTNITLDDTGISRSTRRSKEVYGTDINNDSIMEMPELKSLPDYGAESENFYAITWVQYSVAGQKTPIYTTYYNDKDGWYLILPDEWLESLSVTRTDNVTLGERSITFYHIDGSSGEPEAFLTIYKLTGTNRSVRAKRGERFVLMEESSTIYAAEFTGTWDCGLNNDTLLEQFKFIKTEW